LRKPGGLAMTSDRSRREVYDTRRVM